MEINERIVRYLAACPPAIQGQEGSTQTFCVACKLYWGFNLSESETLSYLQIYNQRCQPPWEDKDLARKANQAAISKKHRGERGHLAGGNGSGFKKEDLLPPVKKEPPIDPATAMEIFLKGFRCMESDLADASPVRPADDWTQDGILLVRHLFEPGEQVNFVTRFKLYQPKSGAAEKANPDGVGDSVERDDLCLNWDIAGMPQSDAGGWLRMNPVDGKGVNDANITAFRFALIEFDRIPLDLQLAFLSKLPLPISAILTSGGKSVHAWVRVDATDFGDYEDSAMRIREVMSRFGVDRANKNPSRLSRLPGVMRVIGANGDGRQRLIYLSPKPEQRAIL